LKYIIESNGQIIKVRNRKFYHPEKAKWINDSVLAKYSPEKLESRFGIYKFKEISFDSNYYKTIGYIDTKDKFTITRTYELEPKKDPTYWRNQKRKQYKMEGIRLYVQANQVEPVLEFTGDDMDLVVYKQSVRDAFMAARAELRAILEDTTLSDYEKYEAISAHQVVWPDPPIDEDTWREYGDA
jgi:uncharacterized protein (DUF2164 family)